MRIQWHREDDIVVAELGGRIDGSNAGQFNRRMDEAVSPNDHHLILNFGGVSFISSAGLRVASILAKQFHASGRKFAVCALSAPVRQIFKVTGFDQVMAIHESQADAIDALGNAESGSTGKDSLR